MTQIEIKIATRASPLALAQSETIAAPLRAYGHNVRLIPFSTRGDRDKTTPLADIGGKGLFTEELHRALLAEEVDFAVHSYKDLPSLQPDGLMLAATPLREAVEDVLILRQGVTVSDEDDGLSILPEGAVVGTSSLRRGAQLLRARPDLSIRPYRGNIDSRLANLDARQAPFATLLALAGLKRLGRVPLSYLTLPSDRFMPAPAQGALALQCRQADTNMQDILASLHHRETGFRVAAERSFLAHLEGSCRIPIAALAHVNDNELTLSGELLSPDGKAGGSETRTAPVEDAAALGMDVAEAIKQQHGKLLAKLMDL